MITQKVKKYQIMEVFTLIIGGVVILGFSAGFSIRKPKGF